MHQQIKTTVMITSNNISDYKVVKETEKAIAFKAWKTFNMGRGKSIEWNIWVPKSVIKNGVIANWFLNKLESEAMDFDYTLTFELA